MICMAAAGRKKGLSERIGKIFAEIINIFTGSFWTECPEVDNGLKNRLGGAVWRRKYISRKKNRNSAEGLRRRLQSCMGLRISLSWMQEDTAL